MSVAATHLVHRFRTRISSMALAVTETLARSGLPACSHCRKDRKPFAGVIKVYGFPWWIYSASRTSFWHLYIYIRIYIYNTYIYIIRIYIYIYICIEFVSRYLARGMRSCWMVLICVAGSTENSNSRLKAARKSSIAGSLVLHLRYP